MYIVKSGRQQLEKCLSVKENHRTHAVIFWGKERYTGHQTLTKKVRMMIAKHLGLEFHLAVKGTSTKLSGANTHQTACYNLGSLLTLVVL